MKLPIIRLEVEGMKYTMQTALQEHVARMDASIIEAVERYCTPENINAVVQKAATEALNCAVKEEVRDFFSRTGNGRKVVREFVNSYLEQMYPDKP